MSQRFTQVCWAEPDLFLAVDEQLFPSAQGASFQWRPLQKAVDPVLTLTEPWEGGTGGSPGENAQDAIVQSVVFDRELQRYMMWYRTHSRLTMNSTDPALGAGAAQHAFRRQASQVCLATSADGLHWEKPHLNRVSFDGRCDNNMLAIATGPILDDALGCVAPVPGAEALLVATVHSAYHDPLYPRGIIHLTSRDGIDWQPHFPPMLPLDGDAHCLMWDARLSCWLCTTRSEQHRRIFTRLRPRLPELRHKRHVALALSRDLQRWTPMLDVLEADDRDAPQAELYEMYILPYGHLYLGFVQLFYPSADLTFGPLEMQLAYSRDLVTWRRAGERQAILPRGEAGSWDAAHTTLGHNPPVAHGHDLRFWYGGKNTEHWQAGTAAVGTATVRRDGFAGWYADHHGGHVTSDIMHLRWATWPMLNVDARDGEARLEVLDAAGNPLEGCTRDDCQPIAGDHLRAVVNYGPRRGNFIRHTGPIRFRIHLRNATFYALKAPNVQLEPSS